MPLLSSSSSCGCLIDGQDSKVFESNQQFIWFIRTSYKYIDRLVGVALYNLWSSTTTTLTLLCTRVLLESGMNHNGFTATSKHRGAFA